MIHLRYGNLYIQRTHVRMAWLTIYQS